uniref:Homeobox-containing protein 1 n=1 Tax=Oncorhynchus mykiss TaxID=8022 RepID=A0A8C7M0V4_ONCMY
MVKCTEAHQDREPRMSHYTDEPRFTIEQIDLLQRLRRTGMTKQEILHALDTLDRLDREHGAKFGHRTSYGGGASSSVSDPNCTTSNNTAATTSSSSITVDDDDNNNNNNSTSGSSEVNNTTLASSCTNSTVAQTQYLSPRGGLSPSPSNSYDTSPLPSAVRHSPVSLVTMAQNGGRDSLAATPNGKLSPPRYPVNSAAAARAFGFEATEEELEIDDKVEELMRRDGSIVKEEIKSFLGNRRISQAVVAQVTGATLNMRPAPMAMEEMEWRQTTPHISTAPGIFRLRRGSRFTWRKECLAVMESYFNDNQYPDEAKREEISNACNAVIQKPGKKLSDLERVSSLKVYNWFANRRKEIKRRANIEATILESHWIDVQSPGGHSNSDDIDGGDYTEQACDLPYFDKRPMARPFGFYRLEPTSPTQDDGTDHQDPISLAVEMAAVNHTILALSRTGGVPSNIKTEVPDDD